MSDSGLEIFDLWQVPASRQVAELSFSLGGVSEPESPPVWRLDLGASPDAARQRLGALETQARLTRHQLDDVPGRLDQFLTVSAPRPDDEISFGLGEAPAPIPVLGEAERELLAMTAEARGEVSFGVSPAEIGQAVDEAKATLQRFARSLTHAAWVETTAAGHLVGRTTVGWTGRTRTARLAGAGTSTSALHLRNVSLALSSRFTLLRTLVLVQEGALKLSLVLGASGGLGAVAAVPMVWRYVQKILAEIRRTP